MAKSTKKQTGGKQVEGITIRQFSYSSGDGFEFEFADDFEFTGVHINNCVFNLPFEVYIDLTHGRMMIGCQNRTLADWQKLSLRAAKKLATDENLTKDHVAAFQQILTLALKMQPNMAKIEDLRAKLAALEKESEIKSVEIAKSLAEKLAEAAMIPDEDEYEYEKSRESNGSQE